MAKKKNISKWAIDYTKYSVYQAWEVTAHRTGALICQMIILKEKHLPYRFYEIVEGKYTSQEAHWKELRKGDFFIRIREYEGEVTKGFYDYQGKYHYQERTFDVVQVRGPECGKEFPEYNNVPKLIEACEVCDNSHMPLFFYRIYEDRANQINVEIAYPGDSEFRALGSKDIWERNLIKNPNSTTEYLKFWSQKNIYLSEPTMGELWHREMRRKFPNAYNLPLQHPCWLDAENRVSDRYDYEQEYFL